MHMRLRQGLNHAHSNNEVSKNRPRTDFSCPVAYVIDVIPEWPTAFQGIECRQVSPRYRSFLKVHRMWRVLITCPVVKTD